MKKFSLLDVAAPVIWILPGVYLLLIYNSLPQTVPVHYTLNGVADRYGDKNEFLIFQWIIMGVGALVYLLLKFLPSIDPKNRAKNSEKTFQKLGFGIILFFSALDIIILFATLHHGLKVEKVILPLVGLLLAYIGNIMHSIKPNYFAGLRTPWTLESEDTWRATHRLAGKLWFAGGIILTIAVLLLPAKTGLIVFMCGVGIILFVPVVYSYLYFRKHQPGQNS